MDFKRNIINIKHALNLKTPTSKSLKHQITHTHFFPFLTREPERVKFKNGFNPIVGGVTRFICHKKECNIHDEEALIEKIMNGSSLMFETDEDKEIFRNILKLYLFESNDQLRIFSPYMFLFQPFSNNKEVLGERKLSSFLYDVLCGKFEELENFLNKHQKMNLLGNLIIEQLKDLEDSGEKKQEYINKLPFIKELFQEDVRFLMKKTERFIENFPMLLAYYYFFYITQLTVKVSSFEEVDFSNPTEFYYLMDGEAAHKSRKSYTQGFNKIKELDWYLYSHLITLDHLNYLLDASGEYTYQQLFEKFSHLTHDEQQECLTEMKAWMKEYIQLKDVEDFSIQGESFKELVKEYFTMIHEINGESASFKRYRLSIHEIGKKYFLKRRGSLGYMLYVTQDLLLLLTAVCIKDEKISLNQLFIELSKRGLFFDRYSREEIIQLFNKLNLIDKKSDSGDAQYVKRIL